MITDDFVDKFRGEYRLTCDEERLSLDTIWRWLSTDAYWTAGRSRESVEASIENSFLYGVLDGEGEIVAFARALTDRATFLWVCDVYVNRASRGQGLGTWMVAEVVDHWTKVGVPRFLLATRDAHEVYAKVGFSPVASPDRYMEIDRRPKA